MHRFYGSRVGEHVGTHSAWRGTRSQTCADSRSVEREAALVTTMVMGVWPLPTDQTIARLCGELMAIARSRGRGSKATDLPIVATASPTGRTLLTMDGHQASVAAVAGVAVNPPVFASPPTSP